MTAPALGPGSRWHAAVVEIAVHMHAARIRHAERHAYREVQVAKWEDLADTYRRVLDQCGPGDWQIPNVMRLRDMALWRACAWRALLTAEHDDARLASHKATRLAQECERAKGRAV